MYFWAQLLIKDTIFCVKTDTFFDFLMITQIFSVCAENPCENGATCHTLLDVFRVSWMCSVYYGCVPCIMDVFHV